MEVVALVGRRKDEAIGSTAENEPLLGLRSPVQSTTHHASLSALVLHLFAHGVFRFALVFPSSSLITLVG